MTQPTQMLRQARDLVARGWCQGVPARREDDMRARATEERACKWCATGALEAVMFRENTTWDSLYDSFDLLCSAIEASGYKLWNTSSNLTQSQLDSGRVQRFNDTMGRTQEEVVAVFEEAIAKEAS